MIVELKKIKELSDGKVSYYSVRLNDNLLTEFELFLQKDFPDHEKELQILFQTLDKMKIKGARSYYFKPEGPANALPVVSQQIKESNKNDFGIRLYCIRLTDNLIILLNGDIKTVKHTPLACPNVAPHFKIAQKIARKLDKLMINKEISFQEENCLLNLNIEI